MEPVGHLLLPVLYLIELKSKEMLLGLISIWLLKYYYLVIILIMDATEEIPLMLTNTSTTKEFPMKPVLVTKLSVTTTDYPVPVKSSAKTAPPKKDVGLKTNILIIELKNSEKLQEKNK